MNEHDSSGMIGGRYQLGELLGRGGMAEVRKAIDTRLGRVVAIKRLRTDLATDDTFQARFRREAQSSAALNHPTIVAVYDTGEERASDGTVRPYIVMEYVEGRTLRDVLREGRKILPERALEITSGVLSALDYSHRAGIIHRDIKPGNVMLTPAGDVKVMDFGIARALSDAASSMTQTAAVVGTAQYLSPEQARGETVDTRSDVYSAGCLLYELLTGRPPFVGDSPVAVAVQHVREPAVPPSHLDADLPEAIDAIAMKALTKRLDERYQSAALMRHDIERYLAGRPVHAVLTPPDPAPGPAPTRVVPAVHDATTVAPAVANHRDEEERGNRTGFLLLVGLLVVALIAAAYWVWPRLFDTSPPDVRVPDAIGLDRDAALDLMGDAGLRPDHTEVCHDDDRYDAGQVFAQDPEAGEYVAPGGSVALTVSTGMCEFSMPGLVGKRQRAAVNELTEAGIPRRNITVNTCNEDDPEGTVVSTEPESGTTISRDSEIVLCVSDGPEQVPNLIGLTEEEASDALRARNFTPVAAEEDDGKTEAGLVIRQSVDAGETRTKGSQITFWVSTYEPEEEEEEEEEEPDEEDEEDEDGLLGDVGPP